MPLNEEELAECPEFRGILAECYDPREQLYTYPKSIWVPRVSSLNRFLDDYRARCQE